MMFNQWMLCFKCSILHSDRQNWSWIRDPKFPVNINRYFWRFLTWNLNWQKENSFSSPNSQTANQMAKPNDQETDKKQDHLEMAASEEFFWYLEISLNPTLKLINRHKHVIRNLIWIAQKCSKFQMNRTKCCLIWPNRIDIIQIEPLLHLK